MPNFVEIQLELVELSYTNQKRWAYKSENISSMKLSEVINKLGKIIHSEKIVLLDFCASLWDSVTHAESVCR